MFCYGPSKSKELQGFDRLKILGDCEVEGLCDGLVGDGWPVERVCEACEAVCNEGGFIAGV